MPFRDVVGHVRLIDLLSRGPPTTNALRELVRFHGPPDAPLDGACVHAPAFNYGTRSSFQLVLPSSGAPSALWTEGAPCTNPPSDITPLVQQLLKR